MDYSHSTWMTLKSAKKRAMLAAGKTGMNQMIFELPEGEFLQFSRGDGTEDSCIRLAEAFGCKLIDFVQVLK